MQLVQTISASKRGGIQQVSEAYAIGFSENGDSMLSLVDLPAVLHHGYEAEHSTIQETPGISSPWRWLSPVALMNFRKLVRTGEIEAAIAHNGHTIRFMRACSLPDFPIVSVCHMEKVGRRLEADVILCLTEKQRSLAIEALGDRAAAKTVVAVGNPLILPPIPDAGAIAKQRLLDTKIVLGTLSNLAHRKGLDVLVQALAKVRSQGVDLHVRFGGHGPEAEGLRRLAGELGVGEAVEFAGYIGDRDAYFAGLDMFCLPSRIEPFGLALIEAMSRALPVCASDTEGPSEILASPSNGWLFRNGDAESLAAQLLAMVSSVDHARTVAAAAARHAVEMYSPRAVACRIKQVIEGHRAKTSAKASRAS